ncbi:MerR family transcriptional regulator [Alkalihalobacillus alcalophilus ATCC 27647 = CGMCC 1.3604]|uniref:MerR family transcriptional regulator n=1 Tax=Alkalihalobacillus alcalophilus ATCC 27647 = CGMCC 1.3604 TaxID=1218173 RepID=A0A094YXV0_ALKAL|nr:MerR family transcriptional regulator [Alkalihalobacillus alcalophilus]KGA98357.1 MerR family transcriptional regulator [Alkalihalobacillus alcalophilus ATCC 27647 = CGMCC 1.3604]MED1563657.1 MerR family transcriptional regulator [Alkalihalobacillus alcalophilus]THG91612.1 MerR family transcriptional regulator [Alkalihalobacillus alcalophilus ATCC 27647 = CGMCC 1.3604]
MSMGNPTYTISEFGRKTGITVRTLRFYEEIGLLIPTEQNQTGHRLYGLVELAKLQQIQSLKFIGYSLQEIKELLGKDEDALAKLENSLPMQHQLLTEKRNELNQAIEAVEHVQTLIKEGKPVTWTVLSALLYQMEHEQEQKEWMKENMPRELVEQFFNLPKEQQKAVDMEMLDVLATIKELMKNGVAPNSNEAFQVVIRMTDIMTRNIEDKEALLEQFEKFEVEFVMSEAEFQVPNFFTKEEEVWLDEVGKAMEEQFKQSKFE